MNYFKCLFTLVLSVGMISSAFAQLFPRRAPELEDCLPEVYKNVPDGSDWRFPFEVEIGYKDKWFRADQMIFLITRTDSEKEQLCTLYTGLEVESNDLHNYFFVRDTSLSESKGRVGSSSVVHLVVIGSRSTCKSVTFQTVENFIPNPSRIGDLGVQETVRARKIEERTPRSFDELYEACGF